MTLVRPYNAVRKWHNAFFFRANDPAYVQLLRGLRRGPPPWLDARDAAPALDMLGGYSRPLGPPGSTPRAALPKSFYQWLSRGGEGNRLPDGRKITASFTGQNRRMRRHPNDA